MSYIGKAGQELTFADIGTHVPSTTDALQKDTTNNVSVGYTTTVETVSYSGAGTDEVAVDMQTQSIKTINVTKNTKINFPTNGFGVAHLILKADASGPYSITLNSANLKAVGPIPDLDASTNYLATIICETASYAMIQIQGISA